MRGVLFCVIGGALIGAALNSLGLDSAGRWEFWAAFFGAALLVLSA